MSTFRLYAGQIDILCPTSWTDSDAENVMARIDDILDRYGAAIKNEVEAVHKELEVKVRW